MRQDVFMGYNRTFTTTTKGSMKQLVQSPTTIRKVYVANLPYSATDDILRHIFEHVGTVVSAKIVKNPDTGESKGFGFVEMATADAAAEAIERFNGDTYDGRVITVQPARG